MKNSIVLGLGLFLLAGAPALAGDLELGILVDKQIGKAQTLAAASDGLGSGRYDSVSPSGMGFRVAYSLLDLKVASLSAAGTYHPKAEGDLVVGGVTLGKFGNEYVALGLQADWKFLVNFHVGLDYRSEKLTTSINGGGTDSTTLTRPWARVGAGFSLPVPVLSPFVGLEVAAPLTSSSSGTTDAELRKALAPSFQAALYAGVRF